MLSSECIGEEGKDLLLKVAVRIILIAVLRTDVVNEKKSFIYAAMF